MKISFTLLLVFYLFFNIILAPIASRGDDPTESINYEGRGGKGNGSCLGYRDSKGNCYGQTNIDGTCRDFPKGYMQTQYQLGKSCGGGIVKIGFIFYNTDPRNYEINYCIPKLVVPMKSKPSSTFEPALVRVNIKIKTNDNGKNKSKTAHYYNENGQNIYRYGRLKNYSKDSMVWNFTDAGKQLQLLTLGPDSRALSNGKDGTNCHIGITNFGINEKIQITGGGGGNKILGDGINSDDTFSKIPFFLGQDQKNIPNNLPGPESNPS